jgi:hypothetical protein
MTPLEILGAGVIISVIIWCAIQLAPTQVVIHMTAEDRDHHKDEDQ